MKTIGQYWRYSGFYLFYYATLASWIPYWGVYMDARNYGAEFIGLTVGAMMAMRIVGPSAWGYAVGLQEHRRLLLIRAGTILGFVSFALILMAQTKLAILATLIAATFFWNGLLPQFEAVAISALGSAPQNYGWIRLWGSIGFVIFVIICGAIFNNWSVHLLPYCVLTLMVGAIYFTFRVPQESHVESASENISFRKILREPAVVSILLSCALVHLSHGPYYAFYSIYLSDYGYSHTTIGLLWALGVVAECLLFLWVPRVVSSHLTTLFVASILLAALRWFMIALSQGNFVVLFFAQFLHAASFGSFHAACIEWIRRAFADSSASKGQALHVMVGFGIGGTIGALLSGFLWSIYDAAYVYGMAGLVALLALIFAWPLLLHDRKAKVSATAA